MYIYYDRYNNIKEIINDETIVQSSGVNKIYIYYEKVNEITITSCSLRLNQLGGSWEQLLTPTRHSRVLIPFNENRDLQYFNYLDEYTMYEVSIPETTPSGVLYGSIAFNGNITLPTFTFNVENNNIVKNESISVSDYEYLLNKVSGSASAYIEGHGIQIDDNVISVKESELNIPTSTSELDNDSGFITEDDLDDYITTDDVDETIKNTIISSDTTTISETQEGKIQVNLSADLTNKLSKALVTPNGTVSSPELVGIGTNGSQVRIAIGDNLSIENNTLKATGGGSGDSFKLYKHRIEFGDSMGLPSTDVITFISNYPNAITTIQEFNSLFFANTADKLFLNPVNSLGSALISFVGRLNSYYWSDEADGFIDALEISYYQIIGNSLSLVSFNNLLSVTSSSVIEF